MALDWKWRGGEAKEGEEGENFTEAKSHESF